ncbi:hypothetical protein PHDIMM138B_19145 [Phytobacter diazotrophicus]
MERHIGRTFIIPVIIFIYGLWQYSRVSGLAKLAFYFQDNTVIFRYGMTCLGIVFAVLAAVTIGGNDSNLLIVFYVQIMPDDLVMQLHRF